MCIPILCLLLASALVAEQPALTVTLSTPRAAYLIGEPIQLNVTARNDTQGDIETMPPAWQELRFEIAPDGRDFSKLELSNLRAKYGHSRKIFKSGELRAYLIRLLTQAPPGGEDGPGPLAISVPGGYKIRVIYPQYLGLDSRQITTDPVHFDIRAPKGDDRQVFAAIEGVATRAFLASGRVEGGAIPTALMVAKLLKAHPDTGYRESLRWPLLELYHRAKANFEPEDREMVRLLLGEPDDRFFPDDARLDRMVVMDYPKPTHVSIVFESLRQQAGVTLESSPYGMLEQSKISCLRSNMTLREGLLSCGGPPLWAWARRGDAYYSYCETLGSAEGRKDTAEQLGPVPVLFPGDKRLDARVVADCPEPTPIDRVIAGYATQSGVKLSASPFPSRCVQAGGRQTFVLREEMAFLARTFRATWEARGDGYHLAAGAEADAAWPHPGPGPKAASGGPAATLGLAVAAAVALAVGVRLAMRARLRQRVKAG